MRAYLKIEIHVASFPAWHLGLQIIGYVAFWHSTLVAMLRQISPLGKWAEGIEMTRALSVLAALALLCQTADAGPLRKNQTDPRLSAVSFGVGAATTVGFFALRNWQLHNHGRLNGLGINGAAVVTTGACLALSPIVGTLMVKRELTFREAYALTADCVVPFIGGWLVNKAFDAHPEWEPRKARLKR